MKSVFFVLILGILLVDVFADQQGYYSIIGPGTVHPNSNYNVAVSVQNIFEPCKIKLGLEGPNFEKHIEVDVNPMTVENVSFMIPDVKTGDWKLTAEGLKGLIFSNSSIIEFADKKPSIYIQTDKATYKPGDLVQFRIIFLDENTRPAILHKPTTVFIKDAISNRVKQFSNITVSKGVFVGKLQLSEFPLLGSWTIEVQIDGASVYEKKFDVSKYVLPKFQVIIDAPKKVSVQENTLGFTVRSKYTFGKLVKGKTTITVNSYKRANIAPQGPSVPFQINQSFNHNFNPVLPPFPVNSWYPGQYSQPMFEPLITKKTIESNGKVFVEFKMKDLLPDGININMFKTLKIFVETEEELTGKKQNATTDIEVVYNRFQINAPNMVVKCESPRENFNYSVRITNMEGEPVSDKENAVNFSSITPFGEQITMYSAYLNKSGIASITLECEEFMDYRFTVSYQNQQTYGSVKSKKNQETRRQIPVYSLQARLSQSLKLGKQVEIDVLSPEPMPYFVYTIIAKGNIVKSDLIQLPEGERKRHILSLTPTFEMMPSIKLFIYYVQNDNLKFFEENFEIEKEFLNSISISAPPQTIPGGKAALKIRTDPGSYVGLMGVDHSVLLLKSGNDLDGEAILGDLQKLTTKTPNTYVNTTPGNKYPGQFSGVVTMTNANYPHRKQHYYPIASGWNMGGHFVPLSEVPYSSVHVGSASYHMAQPTQKQIIVSEPKQKQQIRQRFLETWFFEDIDSTNPNNTILKKQLPDTITSWIVTGFSLNPETGFALTKTPATIKTFKPFFLTTNLPYSIKRGEKVTIPVILFNYMTEPLIAEVILENEDDEFDFAEPTLDGSIRLVKKVTVEPNNGETISFSIRAKRLGRIDLKIKAISPLAGDAIDKKLNVEPEGITVYKNRDYYLQGEQDGIEIPSQISLDIPKNIVPDSEHIEVSVMGDILGSTITNLDKLVRMPAGCGEQNMINFVPNILVLRYLESINQLSPAIEQKAKNYLEIGYQRELSYKHDNGSYSAFGKSDSSGSTWLTAYVMRSFHQASKYINIDEKVLNQGLKFLANIQSSNGSFPEIGKVLDFSHYNDVGLTAFVLLAFLENTEHTSEYEKTIELGFKYLEENIRQTEDLYALSIAVYALQLHRSPIVLEILPKLDVQAKLDGGLKWWTKSAPESKPEQTWRPKSHDVEVTGYILMTLLEQNEPILPITKWLLTQRNSNGGFSSTQETVVGLQALIKFAEKTNDANKNLKINVASTDGNTSAKEFVVNSDNALVMQTFELHNSARQINMAFTGKGAAILQVSYRYNVLQKEDEPSFKLSVKHKENSVSSKLSMDVCAEFVPLENSKVTNMVVMEVTLPSGYIADKDSFEQLKSVEGVKRVETKKDDTHIVVYLDGLEAAKEKCMPIEAELAHDIEGQKPTPIVIYDYYDSQKRGSEFYSINGDSKLH